MVNYSREAYEEMTRETLRQSSLDREYEKDIYWRYIKARNEVGASQQEFFEAFMSHLNRHTPDEAIRFAQDDWRNG